MGSLPSSNFAFIMSAPYLVYVHPLNKISLERTAAWRSAFRKYRERALWCMQTLACGGQEGGPICTRLRFMIKWYRLRNSTNCG